MRKLWLAFVMAGLMAVWSAPASAVVLYDNGTPDPSSTYGSSDPTNGLFEAYDYFTLLTDATITGVQWWGYYSLPGSPPAEGDAFYYIITQYTGSGDSPGPAIPGDSGPLGDGNRTKLTLFDYQFSATMNVMLQAGTYFLSIYDIAPNEPGNEYVWLGSEETETDAWENNVAGDAWLGPYDEGLAFNLTGTVVPEPATMTLLGLGLAGLVGRRMRRRSGR